MNAFLITDKDGLSTDFVSALKELAGAGLLG
jgi:hypothetical protein